MKQVAEHAGLSRESLYKALVAMETQIRDDYPV